MHSATPSTRAISRVTALLLDSAALDVVGVHTEYGPGAARQGVLHRMMFGSLAKADTQPGIEDRFTRSPAADLGSWRGADSPG